MAYWPTVILTVDNDGYYDIHHRTYLWYTGLDFSKQTYVKTQT